MATVATAASTASKKPVFIDIQNILADEKFQVRVRISPTLVETYYQLLKEGVELDPWTGFELEGGIFLADGFHRRLSYLKAERTQAPIIIMQGSETHALEWAIRRNAHHGEKLSNADKHHAIEMALADTLIRRWADSKIARLCGCSPHLVAETRNPDKKKTVPVSEHKRKAPEPPKAHEPEPETDPFEERVKTLKGWLRSGYFDWQSTLQVLNETEKKMAFVPIIKKAQPVKVFSGGELLYDMVAKSVKIEDGKLEIIVE